MIPAEIQFELKKQGISQKSLAAQIGVHPVSVSRVINRKCVSDRVMRGVAEAIDRDHRDVFPEYYCKSPRRSTSKVN